MSNILLNSLVKSTTTDTLNLAHKSLSFVQESINQLELEELSDSAQQGLCWIIEHINQALIFEADRSRPTGEKLTPERYLGSFETELFEQWPSCANDYHSVINTSIRITRHTK